MLQLRDIPLDENSQGDKNLNFMSYLKKSRYRSRKYLVSKKSLGIGLYHVGGKTAPLSSQFEKRLSFFFGKLQLTQLLMLFIWCSELDRDQMDRKI